MPVDARHVVLYAVEEVSGRPNGKTYIQKLCFFVSTLIGEPLGFRAHYYGPYSEQVSAELAFLTAGGFLTETRRGSGMAGSTGWEIARFDYSLTEEGRKAVKWLGEKFPEESGKVREAIQRILSAGDLDYVALSFAAKTRWILDHSGGPMTPAGIASAAEKFNWNVNGTDVNKASTFLQQLGLVEVIKVPSAARR